MSFKARLTVGGKEFNVLNVNYGLFQETDATGRPSTVTRGGKIELTIEGTGSTELFEWMTNSFERKDGSVKFFKRDSDATLKVNPLTESFTISARKIEMGTGVYENEWV
jgi:hypothetical protein